MVRRLLDFLDASPVSFLAVKNIVAELEQAGFRKIDAREPLGAVKAGEKLYVTKNDSSVYAFRLGRRLLSDAGFRLVCAHCDSPTFRIKPHPEMVCEGGIVKLNTEVYGGPILSTWFDRPLTLAGRVVIRGVDAFSPETLLIHVRRPLLQISNLAIHFNRQVNEGVCLSKQKDMLPILGFVSEQMEAGNLLFGVICEELGKQRQIRREDILDFDLYLADATPACTFGVHDEFISSGRLDDLSMCYAGLEALLAAPSGDTAPCAAPGLPRTAVLGTGQRAGGAVRAGPGQDGRRQRRFRRAHRTSAVFCPKTAAANRACRPFAGRRHRPAGAGPRDREALRPRARAGRSHAPGPGPGGAGGRGAAHPTTRRPDPPPRLRRQAAVGLPHRPQAGPPPAGRHPAGGRGRARALGDRPRHLR